MSSETATKKIIRTKCIKGWYPAQMRKLLKYVFSNCVIDCFIKEGKTPTFVCQLAEHTNKDEIEKFTIHFLEKNKIPLHFTYVIDPPRNPE